MFFCIGFAFFKPFFLGDEVYDLQWDLPSSLFVPTQDANTCFHAPTTFLKTRARIMSMYKDYMQLVHFSMVRMVVVMVIRIEYVSR